MCKLMEDYGKKIEKRVPESVTARVTESVTARVAKETAAEKTKEFAVSLWDDGMRDLEKISRLTKLPLEEVKKLFDGKIA